MSKKTTSSFRLSHEEKEEISNYTNANSIGLRDLVLQAVRQEHNPNALQDFGEMENELAKYKQWWKKYFDHPLFKEVRENGITIHNDDGSTVEMKDATQFMDYLLTEFSDYAL